jgi:predicted GIY-YIG superfamily endonuclease
VALAWSREVGTWGEALREECRIKRLRRIEKEGLIDESSAALSLTPGKPP